MSPLRADAHEFSPAPSVAADATAAAPAAIDIPGPQVEQQSTNTSSLSPLLVPLRWADDTDDDDEDSPSNISSTLASSVTTSPGRDSRGSEPGSHACSEAAAHQPGRPRNSHSGPAAGHSNDTGASTSRKDSRNKRQGAKGAKPTEPATGPSAATWRRAATSSGPPTPTPAPGKPKSKSKPSSATTAAAGQRAAAPWSRSDSRAQAHQPQPQCAVQHANKWQLLATE